jgi:hypothetical protein
MKEYDRQLKRVIEGRIASTRPLIEENLGPMPDFTLESRRSMSVTPWRIAPNFRTGESTFRYYPRWIKKHSFLIDPVSGELNTDQNEQEYSEYIAVHELIHPYQIAPLRARLGKYANLPYPVLMAYLGGQYGDWIEGSAELATLQLGATDKSPENFARYCSKKLATVAIDLHVLGLIPEPAIEQLQLPFELPEKIKEDADIAISEKTENKKRIDHARYSRGMFYCAMIASKTSTSPADLLTSPMKSSELKERAEF